MTETTERSEFSTWAQSKGFDVTQLANTWGPKRFKHDQIESMFYGWSAHAALHTQPAKLDENLAEAVRAVCHVLKTSCQPRETLSLADVRVISDHLASTSTQPTSAVLQAAQILEQIQERFDFIEKVANSALRGLDKSEVLRMLDWLKFEFENSVPPPEVKVEPTAQPCGGCGESRSSNRCIGCFHNFAAIAAGGSKT